MTRWWSQPFAPEGSAAAEGIVKQLGRPQLDPLTVLVREAAQNSWDARTGDGPVDFRISLRTLGPSTVSWRDLVLPGPESSAELPLDEAIAPGSVLLTVSDRGTRGLGGPLRAGTRPSDDEKADFVQFLRNVGEPNDNEFGGGTYGFGKGIFYRLSNTSAILVDTLTSQGDRRLMGSALGNSWYDKEQRYTGRHWWGDLAADGIPDPYVGSEAREIAALLGLPGFDGGGTGTDVIVMAADLGTVGDDGEVRPRTVSEAGLFLASSMLWHLWPKAVAVDSAPMMQFSVDIDGELLQVPDPRSVVELRPFVESLQKVRSGTSHGYRRTVAPKDAGRLALTIAAAGSRSAGDIVELAKPYEGPSHHIARMRVAELVVDYLPTSAHPDGLLRYGGVFRSTVDSDEYFAASEPPTHDSWVEKGLSGTARGVVQNARNFVVKTVDAELGLSDGAAGGQAKGLGGLSSRLASLLPSVAATGAGTRQPSPRTNGPGGPTRTVPRIVDGPTLHRYDGKLHLMAKVHVPPSTADRIVRAEVAVVIEGGARESVPPAGAPVPKVTGWRTHDDRGVDGPQVIVRPGDSSDWWVFATYVPDAVVRFRVTEGAVDGD